MGQNIPWQAAGFPGTSGWAAGPRADVGIGPYEKRGGRMLSALQAPPAVQPATKFHKESLLLFSHFRGKVLLYSENLARNGKITGKRRQERVGHRLGADPRNRPVWFAREQPWRHGRPSPSLPGLMSARGSFHANPGGTAEGSAFRPRYGARALFCCPEKPAVLLAPSSHSEKEYPYHEAATGSHPRRGAGCHRRD